MAIGDFLKGVGQRVGRGLTEVGGYDPMQQVSPEEARMRRQAGLENLQRSLGRSAAIMSGDPQRLALSAQQDEAAKLARKQQEREKSLQSLAQTNPELARMFELFGEKGLQQGYLRQQERQESLASSQQQIQRYKDAGFTDQEINMILAGMTPKDVLEQRPEPVSSFVKTPKELTEEVQQEKLDNPEQLEKLKNIDQAFSVADALQQAANVGFGPIFGTPFKGTAEAVSEKNVLNERVREKFVNQYAGRPSVYINQRVDLLIPQGQYVDETIAASKYQDVQKVLKEGLKEMEDKLNSGAYTGTELLDVQSEYKSIQSLVSDLDVAIDSLKGTKKQTLEPASIYKPTGYYDSYYTGRIQKPQGQ